MKLKHVHRSLRRAGVPALVLPLLTASLLAGCSSATHEPAAAPQASISSQPVAVAAAPAAPAAPKAPAAPAVQTAPAAPAAPAAAPKAPADAPAAPVAPAVQAAPAAPAAPAAVKAEVGQPAPDFTLTDTAGQAHTLSKYTQAGKLVVIEWFNPDCPIARNYHQPTDDMAALAAAYKDKNVVWLAINSGAAGEQGAGLERNREAVEEFKLSYPVLLDESGATGHLYTAKTTPHMYVIDVKGVLRYAGAIDNGDPSKKGEVNYVRQALDEILAGKPVSTATSKAFGCSVKYAR